MEIWDLYDENLNKTGNVVIRGNEIPDGFYHLALEIWIINSQKEVLLLKNALDYSKRYAGSWCCVGGSFISGENQETALIRLLNKKVGIVTTIEKIKPIFLKPVKRNLFKYAYITCILFADFNLNSIVFNDNESTAAMYVDKNELINMCNNGEIAYYLIDRIENEVSKYF
mgnify:FL=1